MDYNPRINNDRTEEEDDDTPNYTWIQDLIDDIQAERTQHNEKIPIDIDECTLDDLDTYGEEYEHQWRII